MPDVRPASRRSHFADAGMTLLRSGAIWCRCDAGPHGFLSIAAHGHADALAVELRHDGVDVLADPGTYCYHGEPKWRTYFRSTRGHNTLELDGTDQSVSGGPFLWTRHAHTRVLAVTQDAEGVTRWQAEHDGYAPFAVHRRSVELDGTLLRITDEVEARREVPCVLSWHLGPRIRVELVGRSAHLSWDELRAEMTLPPGLTWVAHCGEEDPPLGWYSLGFGRKTPSTTLVGTGIAKPGSATFTALLRFAG